MPEEQRGRRVFEVAKELKVVTPTIIDFLESRGYDVSRKQMHPVTEEMYVELLHKFDKNRYQQYQTEHSTAKEAVQKRDSERLRKEEQEKLLAAPKKVDKKSFPRKVKLPQFEEFILQGAPLTVEPAVEPVPTMTVEPGESAPLIEETGVAPVVVLEAVKAAPEKVETPQPQESAAGTPLPPVVEEPVPVPIVQPTQPSEPLISEKPVRATVAAPVVETIAPVSGLPAVVEAVKPALEEQRIIPAGEPESVTPGIVEDKPHVRKIELPQPRSLKIVQQAPKRPEPAPPRAASGERLPRGETPSQRPRRGAVPGERPRGERQPERPRGEGQPERPRSEGQPDRTRRSEHGGERGQQRPEVGGDRRPRPEAGGDRRPRPEVGGDRRPRTESTPDRSTRAVLTEAQRLEQERRQRKPREHQAAQPAVSPIVEEVRKIDEESKPARRHLKRKRVAQPIETPEDAIFSEQEVKLSKDLEKHAKQKVVAKREVAVVAKQPRKKPPKKKTEEETALEIQVKARRQKKRQKVSATEVAATIKETMAKVEGRDKGKKRHLHIRADEALVEENLKMQVTEYITTQELAGLLEITYTELIQRCLSMGMLISINQRLDRDTIVLLAAEFGAEVEFVQEKEIEEVVEDVKEENLQRRSPVVTIMGHVDHGKTTLLDHLRRSRVAEGEVGGITQHIGAYAVNYNGQHITFLDTPGHEAFTAMRARGAQITDIVVLVVAADDRVMPQTLEAIDHARAANTPIVVAINKIDKPSADPEKIYKELADHNILVEKWGGNYQSTEISAKFGQGVDDLLSEIIVAAEVLDLKADPTTRARGVVVETRLDKGLGAVCTVLVQGGTLKVGDAIVVGESYGRVRALYNELNERVDEAGPATPIQVVGFTGIPQAGDYLVVQTNEKDARDLSQRRQRQHREISAHKIHSLTLEQASRQMQEAGLKELLLLIKGDVHGSVEVLSDALMKLSTKEVKLEIIHKGVGGITESDILLAAASQAIIIGFHVHPNPQAREVARREGVEIRLYRIIHEVVDEIKASLEGLLAPSREEQTIGAVEIRQVYKISRIGTVAGCHVLEGKITRTSKVRLIRDSIEIWAGELSSLKRFKDDAKEVVQGFECGLSLDGFKEILEGDRLEAYIIVEKKRKLEDSE